MTGRLHMAEHLTGPQNSNTKIIKAQNSDKDFLGQRRCLPFKEKPHRRQ